MRRRAALPAGWDAGRRAALAVLCTATAAVVLATPPTPPVAAGSQGRAAGSADCVRHKHSKRIVRHVRRHGRWRKVVRVRVWWTCDPVTPPPPARLGVKAFEYGYLLSRPRVAKGDLILELDNQGEDPHNLNIAPQGSSEPLIHYEDAASGERVSKRFALGPGTYRLWCDLEEHDARGMHATLLVDP